MYLSIPFSIFVSYMVPKKPQPLPVLEGTPGPKRAWVVYMRRFVNIFICFTSGND